MLIKTDFNLTAVLGNLHNYDGLALRRHLYITVVESTIAVFSGYALSQNKNKIEISYKASREKSFHLYFTSYGEFIKRISWMKTL